MYIHNPFLFWFLALSIIEGKALLVTLLHNLSKHLREHVLSGSYSQATDKCHRLQTLSFPLGFLCAQVHLYNVFVTCYSVNCFGCWKQVWDICFVLIHSIYYDAKILWRFIPCFISMMIVLFLSCLQIYTYFIIMALYVYVCVYICSYVCM